MKRILTIISSLAVLAGCSKVAENDGAYGTLNLSLTQDTELADASKSSIEDFFRAPKKDDYLITLTNYAGATAWQGHLSEWDTELRLIEGDYTATAEYGDPSKEGLAKPYMAGSVAFTINAMECAQANIQTSLANCILQIKTSSGFKNYFSKAGFTISTGAGNEFKLEEGQTGFVDAFKFSLNADCRTASGQTVTFCKEYDCLKPATAYTIAVDVTNVGALGITVTFNDEVETIIIEEDLN